MKKTLLPILFALFLLFSAKVGAQEKPSAKMPELDRSGIYLGAQVSTNGWGGEAKYIFNRRFSVKAGFENLNFDYAFEFDEDKITFGADLAYKTGGVYLLGDFNFTKNLYFSGGILFNSFNPQMYGEATSDLQYGDINIPASEIGDFNFSIKPGLKVSPYGGLGIRSFIGKGKRVVLNFDGGFYYMGEPKVEIEATGLLSPTAAPEQGQKEIFEKQLEQYKFYPVAKITLAVRIFQFNKQ